MKKKTFKNFFLILAIIFTFATVFWGYSNFRFALEAKRGEGVVVEIKEHTRRAKRKQKKSYHPVVEFVVADGSRQRFESQVGTNPASHVVGEEVAVLYDPNNPKKAIINGLFENFLGPVVMGLFAGFFGFLFYVGRREKQKQVSETNVLNIHL